MNNNNNNRTRTLLPLVWKVGTFVHTEFVSPLSPPRKTRSRNLVLLKCTYNCTVGWSDFWRTKWGHLTRCAKDPIPNLVFQSCVFKRCKGIKNIVFYAPLSQALNSTPTVTSDTPPPFLWNVKLQIESGAFSSVAIHDRTTKGKTLNFLCFRKLGCKGLMLLLISFSCS